MPEAGDHQDPHSTHNPYTRKQDDQHIDGDCCRLRVVTPRGTGRHTDVAVLQTEEVFSAVQAASFHSSVRY